MDKFIRNYDETELKTATEFLSNWLPFLSDGLCNSCTKVLSDRIRSISSEKNIAVSTPVLVERKQCKEDGGSCSTRPIGSRSGCIDKNDNSDTHSLGSWKDEADDSTEYATEVSSPSETFSSSAPLATPVVKKSWADMAQEDELLEEEDYEEIAKAFYGNRFVQGRGSGDEAKQKVALSRDQREYIRFSSVKRQKDFICLERVNGKLVNILQGLELHAGVFSAAEQKRIVKFVEELRNMGSNGQLKERTYSAPAKWMRGKGQVTLQFGCCYNYANDKNGNPPGILKNELVDPLPRLFKVMIKRLVRWHVLPPSCVPDSCIVNVYDEGDCIPPQIDNHDFVRPFCTVSFLSECEILFGSNLKIVGPGDFTGFAIPLPVGSVLVLNGNGSDIAKHCVPAVPTKRITITFRKMDDSKWPLGYVPEPDLQGLQPLLDEVDSHRTPIKYNNNNNKSSGPVRFSGKPSPIAREERVDSGRRIIGRYPDNNNGHYSGRGRGFGARYPDNNNGQISSPRHFSGRARMDFI